MRYRMLIAEDELEEYELVSYLLDRYDMTASLEIYHAENGKQALKILEEMPIDLMLTDIEMPFVNGLKIAEKARAGNPDLPIIFFSCYDDFTYMKTALKIQADNYLLKPLDPQEFEKTMRHVFELLHEAERREKERENREHILKNHYLYLKLNRMPCEDLPDAELIDTCSQLVLFHFEEAFFGRTSGRPEELTAVLKELFPFSFEHLNLDPFQSVLLLQGERGDHTEQLAGCCLRAHERIRQIYHATCYIAISSPIADGYDLADAWEEVCDLHKLRFWEREKYVFHKQDMGESPLQDIGECSKILKKVERDMELCDMEQLTEDIRKLCRIFEQDGNFSHIYVRYIFSNLIRILYRYQDSPEMAQDIERVFACSFIGQIEQIVSSILAKMDMDSKYATPGRKHSVQLVSQYIQEHYGEPLTLNDLADTVYLNPSYLSTIFKAETGNSINSYIRAVRMERAKQILLQTNMRVGDVGSTVGFNNTSYFIRSFHAYFGETPDRMRIRQK